MIIPRELKTVNITPVNKRDELSDKKNYRPVSLLPLLLTVFERLTYDEFSKYLEEYLNTLFCSFFRSSFHSTYSFQTFASLARSFAGFVGTILMDLHKAYYCLPNDFLIAKIQAYRMDGFKFNTQLIHNGNYKLLTFKRIKKYLAAEKAKLLCSVFINNKFSYVFMIWMFCCKKDDLKIEKGQHEDLKIILYNIESYEELLICNNEVPIHQKHSGSLSR